MAVDDKYGRFTPERGSIGKDEPVVVFRGKDRLLPELLAVYERMCEHEGADEHSVRVIAQRRQEIVAWQAAHPRQVKTPDTTPEQVPLSPGKEVTEE